MTNINERAAVDIEFFCSNIISIINIYHFNFSYNLSIINSDKHRF